MRGPLAHRIARQPEQAAAHMNSWAPVPQGETRGVEAVDRPGYAGEPMEGYHPVPKHDMIMPMSIVYVSGDATVIEEAAPLVTNRGVVPAQSRGQWDQIYAGR